MTTSTPSRSFFPIALAALASTGLLLSVNFSYVPRETVLFLVLNAATILSALAGVVFLVLGTRGRPAPVRPELPNTAFALPAGPRRRQLESHVRADQVALPAGRR